MRNTLIPDTIPASFDECEDFVISLGSSFEEIQ